MFIFFIFFLIGLSFTTYDFISRPSKIRIITNKLKLFFWNNRNPILSGYLFYAIGYFIGLNNVKLEKKKSIIFFIISALLLLVETIFVKNHLEDIIQYEFLLMHIPVIIFLFLFLIEIKPKIKFNNIAIRKISTYTYYFHILVIFFISNW